MTTGDGLEVQHEVKVHTSETCDQEGNESDESGEDEDEDDTEDDEEEQEDLDENKNDPEWDEMVDKAAQRGSQVNIFKQEKCTPKRDNRDQVRHEL